MVESEERSLFWWITAAKRRKADAFMEAPTRTTFRELISPYHFYGTQGMDDPDRWLAEDIYATHSPTDLEELIRLSIDRDTPRPLTAVPGLDWPKATEVLRSAAPDQFAIFNSRAVACLDALGTPTEPFESLSEDRYLSFRQTVKDVTAEHEFVELVRSLEGNSIPAWATPFEVADCVFQYHFNGKLDLSEQVD